ncbi:hypothetical protein NEISICOT_00754 [Neisseria sicca ATCC 29256]|uniref:Uncharacterized protein n=1 Tax=Neisseria sicca ATCC 29256 TaxID=547045 RepID=C6M2L5_NEISI|nr:hypothetical protein NEISICOT_00754 [Neisseria sicca ATCC 29256]
MSKQTSRKYLKIASNHRSFRLDGNVLRSEPNRSNTYLASLLS